MEYEKQQHKALAQPSSNLAAQFQYMRASFLALRDVSLDEVKPGPLVPEAGQIQADEVADPEHGRKTGS